MRYIAILSIIIAGFLSGCNLTDYVFMPKKDWDAEKAKLEKMYGDKAAAAIKEIELERKNKEDAESVNLHKAAGLSYGIYTLSELKPVEQRSRPDTLINLKSKELVTRLPGLTTEELMAVNDELKKELDEKNTTIADLQKKYNDAMAQAEKDKANIAAIQQQIDSKKAELAQIEKDKSQAEQDLADARHKADEKDKLLLAEKASNKAAEEALKAMLIKIFIGISIGCAVAAYALRSFILAAAAAAALGISLFIVYLEPWMVFTGGGIIAVAILGGIGYKWYQTHKAHLSEKSLADSLVGSIQDFKNKIGVDKFKQDFAPHIQEWIKSVPGAEDKIQAKLKELNLV